MFSIKRAILLLLLCAAVCRGEVWIELVPSPPPPHHPEQFVTLSVYAHSEVSADRYVTMVQVDFSDSDSAITLGSTFAFDLSTSTVPQDFTVSPTLPVPWAWNFYEYGCNSCFLFLPAQGVLHIGDVPLQLPLSIGNYRVDSLNADDPNGTRGAQIGAGGPSWRAFTGEITGGAYGFVVVQQEGIPAISGWGAIVMAATLLGMGSLILRKRQQGSRSVLVCTSCVAVLIPGSGAPVIAQPGGWHGPRLRGHAFTGKWFSPGKRARPNP